MGDTCLKTLAIEGLQAASTRIPALIVRKRELYDDGLWATAIFNIEHGLVRLV